MNAAAKTIHESNFFSGQLADIRVPRSFCLHVILIIALLINALLIIYVTNLYRVTFNKLQNIEQQSYQLQLERGQLLLERASLVRPQRVEYIAKHKLGMSLPDEKHIIILPYQ